MLNNRANVVQAMIDLHGYKSYLEIGCRTDETFSVIVCDEKVGVDPAEGGTLRMTSDDFFAQSKRKFDIIFIDGLHQHDQVYRDVQNSLKSLTENGCIVMHDCSPTGGPRYEGLDACGTTWRAYVQFRNHPNLDMMVCDFDHGVGIIMQRPNQAPFDIAAKMNDLTYEILDSNRATILNLKPESEVLSWITGR